jgi:transposase
MGRFAPAGQLSASSGVALGNDESAAKQRAGRTRKRNRALRVGLTQLAHAAARTKGTYLSALYHRLAAGRGKKWAIMAVAPTIVVSAFRTLSRNEPYQELGATHFDEQRRHQFVGRLVRRTERLGYRVSVQPMTAT